MNNLQRVVEQEIQGRKLISSGSVSGSYGQEDIQFGVAGSQQESIKSGSKDSQFEGEIVIKEKIKKNG